MENTYILSIGIFWLSAAVLLYAFAGYPLVIFIRAKVRAVPLKNKVFTGPPAVTVILAAYNEEQRIISRLENLLGSEFPKENFEIIVVSDGSSDNTVQKVRSLNHSNVRVLESDRCGKAHCLNQGVAAATGELIVFGDVRQRFEAKTISQLVSGFSDPKVGAVSGSLSIELAGSAVGSGVDVYWRFERFLRYAESASGSCVGCTGAVYAIRRSLFTPLPVDTLLDDVVIPMQIAERGYRVLFDPAAVAYDPQTLEPEREKIRKQRTQAGNYQMLFRYPGWLLPWKHQLWWLLISHKYLRLVAPFFMILLFVSNAAVMKVSFYGLIFLAQCGFYLLAVCGVLFRRIKIAMFSIPAGFVFLNMMSLNGLRHYLRGSYRQGSWPTAK